jgi:hypothetical protein
MTTTVSVIRTQISVHALIKRINRKLAPKYEQLRKTRGLRYVSSLGEYYMHDCYRNVIIGTSVDPETVGRKLGVLRDFEQVVSEYWKA